MPTRPGTSHAPGAERPERSEARVAEVQLDQVLGTTADLLQEDNIRTVHDRVEEPQLQPMPVECGVVAAGAGQERGRIPSAHHQRAARSDEVQGMAQRPMRRVAMRRSNGNILDNCSGASRGVA